MIRLLPLLIVLAGLGTWLYFRGDAADPALYSGTVEADDTAVGSKVGGRVVRVLVEEGDEVKEGDVLIELDADTLQARLREAEASLEAARQRALELENGTRPEEINRWQAELEAARQELRLRLNGAREEDIAAAKANRDAARAELQLAEVTEKRQKELFTSRDTTADSLDRAVQNRQVAQNRVRAAEAEWQRLAKGFRVEEIEAAQAHVDAASAALALALAGPRREQIAQARAEAARAEAARDRAQVDRKETVILAPAAGAVESSRLEPGDLLPPNQPALTLLLHDPIWVRIFVPESGLGLVPIGQTVGVTVASQPDRTFDGRVVQVNRQAEFTPRNVQTPETRDDLVFGVKILITDPERLLRPGMVADVTLNGSANTAR